MSGIAQSASTSAYRVDFWQLASCFLIIVVFVGCGWRAVKLHHPPGGYNEARMGFGDFQNGCYFPAKAFVAGVSPYGEQYTKKYPVPRPTPLFSPLSFLLHAPLAILPLTVAEWTYFAAMPILLLLLAYTLLREAGLRISSWLLPLIAVMMISRPVGVTLVSGYFTFEIILGVALALAFAKQKPWLAALGLALVSQKPNFVIPLAILMMANGDWRAVWRGTIVSLAGALAAIAWLLRSNSIVDMLAGMQNAQHAHRYDAAELPVSAWTRLDLSGLIAKWTDSNPSESFQFATMLILLAIPAWLLWRIRRLSDADSLLGPRGGLIAVAMLVSIYHHSYDAMLLFAPIVGIVITPDSAWQKVHPQAKWMLLALMLVPLYNITATRMFMLSTVGLEGFGFQLLGSVNAIALAIALILLMLSVARLDRRGSDLVAR